jgi:hypothetical protein
MKSSRKTHRLQQPDGQIANFRAYPEPGKSVLFYRVRIFRTLKTMYGYCKERQAVTGMPAASSNYRGLCTTYQQVLLFADKTQKLSPEIGQILLARKYMLGAVASHECLHGVLGYFDRQKLPVPDRSVITTGSKVTRQEERFCQCLSNLVHRIYQVAAKPGRSVWLC